MDVDFLEVPPLDYAKYSKRRIEAYEEFLSSTNPLPMLGKVRSDLAALEADLTSTIASIQQKLSSTQVITRKLEEYHVMIGEKAVAITGIEGELNKLRLTVEERLLLNQLDLQNNSHPDLLGPIRRLMNIKRLLADGPEGAEDLELVELVRRTNEKVEEWFDRNLSSIQLDCLHPSMSTLVEYMVEIHGLQWFKDVYEKRRSGIKLRILLETLSIGSSSSTNHLKPIELHAHDPFRYINDMLAWLHEAFANELDLIQILLPSFDGRIELANSILVPCVTEIKHRSAPAIQSYQLITDEFRLFLLIAYYGEWFRMRGSHSIAGILEDMKCLSLDYIQSILSEKNKDKPSLIDLKPVQSWCLLCDELVGLSKVADEALGPSDSTVLFNQIHTQLKRTLSMNLEEAIVNLSPNEACICLFNTFGYLDARFPGLPATFELFTLYSSQYCDLLLSRLFDKAMLPETISASHFPPSNLEQSDVILYLRNLSKILIIHNGWDWFKEERRLACTSSMKHQMTTELNSKFFEFYQRLWSMREGDEDDELIKSPGTIRILLQL